MSLPSRCSLQIFWSKFCMRFSPPHWCYMSGPSHPHHITSSLLGPNVLLRTYLLRDVGYSLKTDSNSACQTTACFLYETQRFITVLTKARHRTLFWASRPLIPVYLRSIIPPTLQRLLMFQVPNLMPLFNCLGRAKDSVQVRGTLKYFVTRKMFVVRGC